MYVAYFDAVCILGYLVMVSKQYGADWSFYNASTVLAAWRKTQTSEMITSVLTKTQTSSLLNICTK
jgi:hypothetical protein